MTQTAHQLGQAGSGGGRQYRTGVPQVVEAKVRPTSDRAGGVEVPVQRGRGQVATVAGRKQQGFWFVSHMSCQMLLEGLQKVRRDGNVTTTGLALGSADHEAATGAYYRTLDVDHTSTGVDVDVHVATP